MQNVFNEIKAETLKPSFQKGLIINFMGANYEFTVSLFLKPECYFIEIKSHNDFIKVYSLTEYITMPVSDEDLMNNQYEYLNRFNDIGPLEIFDLIQTTV